MEPIKTYTNGNTELQIFVDELSESPREDFDNLGKMICHHNRYSLGDKHNINPKDYNSYAEMLKDIMVKEDVGVILPMYMLDHSGITISTTKFSCPWDSGQIGFILASKKSIREEFGVKRITKKLIDKVTRILESEVEVYDQYVRGDIYGFKLITDGEEVDSCWGFYGSDIKTNGMLDNIGSPSGLEWKELIASI
jgi:hypothetical protein